VADVEGVRRGSGDGYLDAVEASFRLLVARIVADQVLRAQVVADPPNSNSPDAARSVPLTTLLKGLYSSKYWNGEFMGTAAVSKNGTRVVSALNARANFGKLLNRVDGLRQSLVIEKRGTPKAVLLGIRDYVKLAAPEPEVLRILGEESERNGTSTLTSRQIDRIVKAARAQKAKR
jgi:prevent-host-death family protein